MAAVNGAAGSAETENGVRAMRVSVRTAIQIAEARLAQARQRGLDGRATTEIVGPRIAWNALRLCRDVENHNAHGRAVWLLGWAIGFLWAQGYTPEALATPDGCDAVESIFLAAATMRERHEQHVDWNRTPGHWQAVYRAARTELDRCFDPSGAR